MILFHRPWGGKKRHNQFCLWRIAIEGIFGVEVVAVGASILISSIYDRAAIGHRRHRLIQSLRMLRSEGLKESKRCRSKGYSSNRSKRSKSPAKLERSIKPERAKRSLMWTSTRAVKQSQPVNRNARMGKARGQAKHNISDRVAVGFTLSPERSLTSSLHVQHQTRK